MLGRHGSADQLAGVQTGGIDIPFTLIASLCQRSRPRPAQSTFDPGAQRPHQGQSVRSKLRREIRPLAQCLVFSASRGRFPAVDA